MMDFMKGTTLLLLLAAVSTNADHDHCGGLNKTILGADLHKVVGDWVLVWSVSDSQMDPVEKNVNSHMQTHLSSDNSTLFIMEWNRIKNGSCTTYNASYSVVSDHYKLNLTDMHEETDGVVNPFNDSGIAVFFETCPDCVFLYYDSITGHFLNFYRREGHHEDLQNIPVSYNEFEKLAGCLQIHPTDSFIYKGDKNFCHRTPSPGDAVKASDA